MSSINWKRLRLESGGKWLAYFPPFVVLTPVWLVNSVLLLVEEQTSFHIWMAIWANLIALSFCAIELGVLRFIRNRLGSEVVIPFWLVLLSGFVMGATKAVVTATVYWLAFPEQNLGQEIFQRLPGTTILGMWLLPTLATVFAALERFQLEKQALITALVTDSQKGSATRPGRSEKYSTQLTQLIATTRETLRQTADDPRRVTQLLHEVATSGLRDLSHEIWRNENARFTDFRLSDLARTAIIRHQFPTLSIAIAYVLYTGAVQIFYAGWGEGLLRLGIQVAVIVAVFEVIKRFPVRSFFSGLALYLGAVALTPFLIDVITVQLVGPLGSINRIVIAIILMNCFAFTALVFSIVAIALNTHREIEAELIALLGEAEVSNIRRGTRRLADRELAQYLHGYAQSRILASAMRISAASQQDSISTLTEELQVIENLLTELETHETHSPESFDQEAQCLSTAWGSFSEVTWTYDSKDLATLSASELALLVDICSEAITNSIRHGMATNVAVTVTGNHIRVVDNGTGPRNGSPGLGSALFHSASNDSDWTLTPGEESGSILKITMQRSLEH